MADKIITLRTGPQLNQTKKYTVDEKIYEYFQALSDERNKWKAEYDKLKRS